MSAEPIRPGTLVRSTDPEAPDYRKVGIVTYAAREPHPQYGIEYSVRWLYPDTALPGDKQVLVSSTEIERFQ